MIELSLKPLPKGHPLKGFSQKIKAIKVILKLILVNVLLGFCNFCAISIMNPLYCGS